MKERIVKVLALTALLATCLVGAPSVYADSIAFDNATTAASNSTTSSFTFSHTVSGTNRILFVSVGTYATSLTSVAYGGTNLTLIGSTHESYSSLYVYLYYMVAPATGANDVAITLPSASWVHTTASSYTGASQTDVPDAHDTSTGQALNYAKSLTTVADNSWVVMGAVNANGRAVGAGTDTTLRGLDASSAEMFVDSNGPVSPAGSRTLTVTGTYSSDYWAAVIASFKPALIAFDNATTAASNSTTSSFTFSHTVSGTDRILFVSVGTYATSVTSVTYGGSYLTLIGSTHEAYSNLYAYLYYMVAPATGANDVVITLPSASWVHTTASSYTGASQTGVPDAYDTSTGQALNYGKSLTTSADNSWVVMGAVNANGRAVGAGTDTTLRGLDASSAEMFVDSNGPVSPAGSRTLTVTGTYSSDYWAVVIASFKP